MDMRNSIFPTPRKKKVVPYLFIYGTGRTEQTLCQNIEYPPSVKALCNWLMWPHERMIFRHDDAAVENNDGCV